uniref:Transcriptional regulator, TetR family n=1 Tax=uncultured Thiotrichaceae bacterium TaxID=298394 RepID=A0A6S6T238_9GAMM|nr:MAG: Transcriptional regulator, TetR family [uncultured Thiotrichaceae bacterium]
MPYLKTETPSPEPIDCRILSAALDLFVDNGYHKVSIHHIQQQANVSIGSIYNHFGGKEGIASALYKHILKEIEQVVDDAVKAETSPTLQCKHLINDLFNYTETHRNIIAFVFHAKHVEFLPEEPHACDSIPFVKMRGIIRRGIDCGELQGSDTYVVASAIFGGAIRMIQLRLENNLLQPLPSYLDELMEVTFGGARRNQQPALNGSCKLNDTLCTAV